MLDHIDVGNRSRPPLIPGDIARIEQYVSDLGVNLIIIDPLAAFLSATVDSHRDHDVRAALMLLSRHCCIGAPSFRAVRVAG